MAKVRYLEYNEEKLPISIGYYALKKLQEETKKGLEDVDGDMSLYEPFLFFALEKGHKLEGKKFTLKREDMEDILEECLFPFIELIPEFFPSGLEKAMGKGGRQ